MLDKLSDALKNSIKKLVSSIFIDEKTLNQFVNEIQRALIQSDVNIKLVFEISENIKKRAKEEIGKGQIAKEFIIKIVYEELVKILGGEGHKIEISQKPYKILLIGLFGNGKTTSAAKIARFFKNRGNKVLMVAADTFRPAAYEQLLQLGEQNKIPVVGNPNEKISSNIIKKFKDEFSKYDIIIVDSSGRNALEEDMIKEITAVKEELKPNEILLVQGADVGQSAKEQVEAFKKALNITGVIVTKLDGTAKGGGAITACAVSGAPIKFIGTGEKIEDIEVFDPKRFVSRLLGMGDLDTLLEKAQELMKEKMPEKDIEKRLLSGNFNLNDYIQQIEMVSKMGSLSKILNMIPGMGLANIPKEIINMQEDKMKKFKVIIQSMTPFERENPDKINHSRMERIAKGSGTDISDIKELLKQFMQIRKIVKNLKGKDIEKMAKRMGLSKLPKI